MHNAKCRVRHKKRTGKDYDEYSWYDKDGRKQVVRKYSSQKKAKKGYKKNGLWKKKGGRPEQHKTGGPHFHDRNHDNPSMPNIHYEY